MHCTNHKYSARTGKVTLQWSVAQPKGRRRKLHGKACWAGDTVDVSGRACLGGRGKAHAKWQAGAGVGAVPRLDACQIRQVEETARQRVGSA